MTTLKSLAGKLLERTRQKSKITALATRLQPLYALLGADNPKPLLEAYYSTEEFDGDLLAPLYAQNITAYLDWKLEYENVCHYFNKLLQQRNIKPISFDQGNASLTGEDAAMVCANQFTHAELCFVLIDIGSDGLYVGLIRSNDLPALKRELAIFNYRIMET